MGECVGVISPFENISLQKPGDFLLSRGASSLNIQTCQQVKYGSPTLSASGTGTPLLSLIERDGPGCKCCMSYK